MERRKVLLLGNGINRIDNDYSWEHLMRELLDFTGLTDSISVKDKPFPLLYEEIYLRWVEHSRKPELELKRKIRDLLRNIRSNSLHKQVMGMQVDEVLTTNYDYNLEAAIPGGVRKARYIHPVKGSKYSLLRRRQAQDKIVWHIHGEVHAPGTILLGYEQYAGYLQTIRNYMIQGVKYKELELPSLNLRLKQGDRTVMSWIDHFFFSDVYIVGLNMDFVEMHLWWILDFRARLRFDKRYTIDNKVTFIFPSADASWIKPRIDLLCACDVGAMAVPVVDNQWKKMYRNTLKYISLEA
ncbi:MAG: SIR2 family protein [Bacteroidota bacterium]